MGPSVYGLNTLFCKLPCEISVEPTNTRKPKDNIAKKTVPKSKNKGYHLDYLNLWWNRKVRESSKDEFKMEKEKVKSKMKEYLKKGSTARNQQRVCTEMMDCFKERKCLKDRGIYSSKL